MVTGSDSTYVTGESPRFESELACKFDMRARTCARLFTSVWDLSDGRRCCALTLGLGVCVRIARHSQPA